MVRVAVATPEVPPPLLDSKLYFAIRLPIVNVSAERRACIPLRREMTEESASAPAALLGALLSSAVEPLPALITAGDPASFEWEVAGVCICGVV